jgi:hypothetical protein
MTRIAPDELPNRAFQLAYFLHRERKTATEIATRALNKLQLAATAQGKRLYYRLTGRLTGGAGALKARSKVSMGEPHLLQRLVYVESEEYERRKESAAQNIQADGATPARRSDLVVYFIKHLVRITTRRNSFYVTLGLSRLLYNYTTPETMEIYNLVIQDPDRVHDDYYYRSRKGLLLKELKERFGTLLEVVKGARGEQRWQTEEGEQHHELVNECLRWFTPWATPCVVPERLDPLSSTIEKLTFEGRLPDEEHEVEVNRIHAALHPECFARLAAANQLSAPDERLELPRFFLADDNDDTDDSSRTPPNLSEDELRVINDLLAQEATRRKAVSVGFLRVLVDGVQLAQINAEHSVEARFEVDEAAEMIEVYGTDQRGDLLLATHLLNLNGSETQNFIITVEGGQRITFTVNPLCDGNGSTTGARVAVAFRETAPARAASIAARRVWSSVIGAGRESVPRPAGWWKPVAAFAVLALLFGGAWLVWTNRQDQNEFVMVSPTPAPTTMPTPAAPVPVTPKGAERLQTPGPSVNTAPKNGGDVSPPPVVAQREPNTRERDEALVERNLLLNSSIDAEPGETGTRGGWNRNSMGKPLSEVRQVYIQAPAEGASSEQLLAALRARLAANRVVQISEAEQADAALKISIRPSPAGDSRIIAIVRAVNANGYVVWPVSRRGSSWRYVGQPGYVAERMVADLTRAIESAKGSQ